MSDPAILPELVMRDPGAGAAMLARILGFAPDGPGPEGGTMLRLGPQRIVLRQGEGTGEGAIDHLAIAVNDTDAALREAVARGALLDTDTTPNGPETIPEFWSGGARYVFLKGPEGAKIELCAQLGVTRPGLPGHDHIGIACHDLPAMRLFLMDLGLTERFATVLHRPMGDIPVSFLAHGGSVLELYAPPGLTRAPGGRAPWRRLILTGAGGAGPLEGPEGLQLLRLAD
jgi:catechol 2,3-dioxygenase-like lactoylglutathione lyase family enzyme